MSKPKYTPEELQEIRSLLPAHLQMWLEHEVVPDSDDLPTPGELLNDIPSLRDVPGSHNQLPESYFKAAERPRTRTKVSSLGETSPKATLNPKPGLHAKKPVMEGSDSSDDQPKSLLDLALSDGD